VLLGEGNCSRTFPLSCSGCEGSGKREIEKTRGGKRMEGGKASCIGKSFGEKGGREKGFSVQKTIHKTGE